MEGKAYDLSSRDAIRIAFGVSKDTVTRWKKQGAPIARVGKTFKARREEVWAWLVLEIAKTGNT